MQHSGWLVGGSLLLAAAACMAFVLSLAGFLLVRRSRDKAVADNAGLQQANVALEQSLKAKIEFLATTSHEIRTPLNGILGMTQVLLADRRIDDWLRERIQIVHGAGEAMKALVDDILDLAKIDSGILTIERLPIELRRQLQEAERLWRGQAEGKGLTLALDLSGCPARIEGDPARLRQVLSNLMSNAIKFTSHGSVGLSAAAEPGLGGEVLVIRVRDSGIGIAEDRQDLVFEKFRQADGSIARRFGGTGLGLAICRSLVGAMGGTIKLASRIGEGSTFTVTLPLHRLGDDPRQERGGNGGCRAGRLSDACLLVVEANALTRRIMGNMLGRGTGGIEDAANPAEAACRLARGGIDHVVADAACPGGEDEACLAALLRLADAAAAAGARMTVLVGPPRASAAAALIAARPAVQPIAKPIAAPALLDELRRLYPAEDAAAHPDLQNAASAA